MDIKRIIELLRIEHECMIRASQNKCDRRCDACDIVQEDSELDQMYTKTIQLLTDLKGKECTYGTGDGCKIPG